jgi:hypothetical protein
VLGATRCAVAVAESPATWHTGNDDGRCGVCCRSADPQERRWSGSVEDAL